MSNKVLVKRGLGFEIFLLALAQNSCSKPRHGLDSSVPIPGKQQDFPVVETYSVSIVLISFLQHEMSRFFFVKITDQGDMLT